MKFRDMTIDDVLILENYNQIDLEKEIKNLANIYYIVDLQFSTTRAWNGETFHSALVLVKDKNND